MSMFLITALATFGSASLVTNYDGPFEVFLKLRSRFKLFRCTVCLSCWLAFPMLYLTAIGALSVVLSFAIIGLIIITERLT